MPVSNVLVLVTSLLVACAEAGTTPPVSFAVGGFTPKAVQAPSPDVVTENVVTLARTGGKSKSAAFLKALRNGQVTNGRFEFGSTPLTPEFDGEEYLAPVSFGSQTFQAIIDTGSSDTWLAETGFECLDIDTGDVIPQAECELASSYNPNADKTFTPIKNEVFNITYGDGEFLSGTFGTDTVTFAGIAVPKQQVAVVNMAAWEGDGVSSGLVGLAFPSLTSAFAGNDPHTASLATQIEYNPIFTTMTLDKIVEPVFSMAIERGNNVGGFLALGGVPPVATTGPFASTPIQIFTLASFDILTQFSFYTITADNYVFKNSEQVGFSAGALGPLPKPANEKQFQIIVDSGTTLVYLPTGLANAVNAAFDPPAHFSEDEGAYVVPCHAVAPEFGVTIGGQTFFVNPLDMILEDEGTCFTGIDDGGEGPYILGDVFLKNVVAVFDVGASEMRFAAREFT